jgi:hypothetical protein
VFVDTKAFCDFLALQTLCTEQNHATAIRQGARGFMPSDLSFKKGPVLVAQYDQIRLSARHSKPHAIFAIEPYNDIYFSSI